MIDRERSRAVFRRLREAIPSKLRRRDLDRYWKDTEEDIFYSVVDKNVR